MMMPIARVRTALLAVALVAGTDAASQCRQALALGLDVSGSVDAREYRLQIQGLVAAFDAPPVRAALFAMADAHVDVMVFEWSGPQDQHVLVPWKSIRSPADVQILRETLLQTTRRASSPGTALGAAMRTGLEQLQMRAACWKRTLDISGDGKSNLGTRPQDERDVLARAGITVNALVIGADAPAIGDLRQAEIGELSAYFQAHVITGEDAFVQTALGYEEYGEAMARKLERELTTLILSGVVPGALPELPRQR